MSEFKTVKSVQKEVAKHSQNTLNMILYHNKSNLFLPFINERRLGKLNLKSPAKPLVIIEDPDLESMQFSSQDA